MYAFEDDLRDGVLRGVREREVRVRGAAVVEEFAGAVVEEERGLAGLVREDFHVVPGDAAAPARAEGFERGLLGGEARGVVLGGDDLAAAVAVGALARGEDALAEARRAPEHFTDARDFDNVYADGDDHG